MIQPLLLIPFLLFSQSTPSDPWHVEPSPAAVMVAASGPPLTEPEAPAASDFDPSIFDLPALEDLLADSLADAETLEPPAGPPVAATSTPPPPPTSANPVPRIAPAPSPVVALPAPQALAFGRQVPVVVCVPLRVCDLELQAGEAIDGLVLGDPERWQTEFLLEGDGAGPAIPHVLLRPTDFRLSTNLVVVTSKRTYHVELRSPAEDEVGPEADDASYHHHVRWWYPQDWAQRVRDRSALPPPTIEPDPAMALPALEPTELHVAYEVKVPRRKKRRLPWKPTTVFDDGRRTFLALPDAAARFDLPAVLRRLPTGDLMPVNARLLSGWLVVPEVASELQLVLGTGKARRSLRVLRHD